MKTFKLANIIGGWCVFLIVTVVYLLTIESTASFWDCGEFIAASYKLEVGHPPGAPLFLLLGRFFSLFAGENVTNVARMINVLSALASSFTILFLFWTITHLGKKMVHKNNIISPTDIMIIVGSGLVGSFAYAFSDTFWFSAVEGEVYATSSLFTAIVFWAILKWENVADQPHANRWIILIAYLMGISIGVHLLNLLAIPAIVFVYYFRKYEADWRGIVFALFISVLILALMLYLIIPGVVKVASVFELIFVNGMGLPYNTGIILLIIVFFIAVAYGIWYTHKKRKVLLNTIIVAFSVIVIGYFSYALILIRSAADPPMDQNDPETVFSLLSYLNREQYGQSPLFRGQYYNAPITGSKPGKKIYAKVDGKYKAIHNRPVIQYDRRFTTVLPRMWSAEPNHVNAYKEWGKIEGVAITVTNSRGENEVRRKPTFRENLRFLFRYQLGHMYFRYFMWNFAGRQNDLQGHGEFYKGNWISGIKFIDEPRLGPQEALPDFLANNKARNKYYMLPLVLGLIGFIFQYAGDKKNFWIVLLFFIMTGIAIVVYLNQYPFQPRERDYAYAGSFYAFAVWIGMGVTALSVWLRRQLPGIVSPLLVVAATLVFVPGLMAIENWDDHDRSGRYTARDFAYNYLNSCEPEAILFTNGDNDTFPLWYAQEVEGIRTDIRVVNLSYLGAEWYIDQMTRKAYDSDPVPFAMTKDQYQPGKRDFVYLIARITDHVDLTDAMEFIRSEDPRTKKFGNIRERIDYIPAKKFRMQINPEHIVATGTVRPVLADEIVDEMKWELDQDNLTKNTLMVLDLLENNNWERPVYYAVTVPRDLYIGLQEYFQLQGLAYRIVPIRHPVITGQIGSIDTEIMYNNLIQKFKWGNVDDPAVYLDENNIRMLTNVRSNFGRLAIALIEKGKLDSARVVLDRCMEMMPNERVPFNYFILPIIEGYYRIKEIDTANNIVNKLSYIVGKELQYFLIVDRKFTANLDYEKQLRMHIMQELVRITALYNQEELNKQQLEIFEELMILYSSK